jgi:hypothetical protein
MKLLRCTALVTIVVSSAGVGVSLDRMGLIDMRLVLGAGLLGAVCSVALVIFNIIKGPP